MCLVIISNRFQQLATNSFSTLLEKFKEKKMNVVTVMRECVDAFYPILGKICSQLLLPRLAPQNNETVGRRCD
jgi:hypothetical protein